MASFMWGGGGHAGSAGNKGEYGSDCFCPTKYLTKYLNNSFTKNICLANILCRNIWLLKENMAEKYETFEQTSWLLRLETLWSEWCLNKNSKNGEYCPLSLLIVK